jgi:membrane associated rhomboid family serine protease
MNMRIPPVTMYLLWAIGGIFLLQNLLPAQFTLPFMLWPWGSFSDGTVTVGFMPWQLLTYGLMHGSVMHLFFNAIGLFQFGAALEQTWGSKRYAYFLLVCVVGAGLIQLGVASLDLMNTGPYPTVGISGGIYGLLVGYAMYYPNQRIMLLLPPIPMKARTFVIVFGVIELVLGVTGTRTGIAHFAHLGGALFGWLMIRYWRGQPPFGGNKKKPDYLRGV